MWCHTYLDIVANEDKVAHRDVVAHGDVLAHRDVVSYVQYRDVVTNGDSQQIIEYFCLFEICCC